MSNVSDFIIENGVLTEYVGKDSKVVIPDGVTAIGFEAFAEKKKIKTVVIPESVTEIHATAGSYAETYAKENNIPFVAE